MMKIALLLHNLGGPDTQEAVRPFLFNLFSDPAVFRMPKMPRLALAWLVSTLRAKEARAIYAQLGGGSPLRANTEAQARALEKALAPFCDARVFVAMRCWHPFIEEAVREAVAWQPDKIIQLPLYPQFSTTTTESSFKETARVLAVLENKIPVTEIAAYPEMDGFIHAMAALAKPLIKKASAFGQPRLLLSAHGLPEKIILEGDPYQKQCERTAAALAALFPSCESALCYQSRVGPMKWIGPATDQEIERAGQERRPLVVIPIAFVSEHSETLVELGIQYRKLAEEKGVPFYDVAPTVGTAPAFIEGLALLVRQKIN